MIGLRSVPRSRLKTLFATEKDCREQSKQRGALLRRKYWRVVCRYGHVGIGREISVARYLETGPERTCLDVLLLAKHMPGVKANGVSEVRPITREEWRAGRAAEEDNFYLQRLKGGGRAAG